MVWTIKQVVAEMEVSEREVNWWVEQRWVLPGEEEGEVLFDEVDRARMQLIVELRRDLEVNDEAIPVVLRLLDQVYALRRTLDELREGILGLSEDARAELEASLEQIRKAR